MSRFRREAWPVAFTTDVSGRFVRVQLRGTNYLGLAEVQIFAL